MKKTKLTIEVSEDKLNALEIFIKEKESTVQIELEETFDKLYERIVPKHVKHYVDQTSRKNKP